MSPMEVPAEILAMPVADRMALVEKIWESISNERAVPLSDEQRRILEERLAEHRANPNSGTPWKQVKKELLGDR